MWKFSFCFDEARQDVLSRDDQQTPLYSTLPPFSYDWIYKGLAFASPEEDMPPLVKPEYLPEVPVSEMAGPTTEAKAKLKCVLVGDGAVGKTSLVVSYTTNGYPTEYVPTAFDNYNVIVNVDNQPIRLQLCDTAGQEDFDTLRPLCYPDSDVFLVCFSVVSPTSFQNVRDKWLPELRLHNSKVPILLIGTQSDLRTDVKVLIELAQQNEQPVPSSAAWTLAHQMDAVGYVESSALTQKNLKEVFDQAIVAALESQTPLIRKPVRATPKKQRGPVNAFVRSENVVDYTGERRSKNGWRKFCCFS